MRYASGVEPVEIRSLPVPSAPIASPATHMIAGHRHSGSSALGLAPAPAPIRYPDRPPRRSCIHDRQRETHQRLRAGCSENNRAKQKQALRGSPPVVFRKALGHPLGREFIVRAGAFEHLDGRGSRPGCRARGNSLEAHAGEHRLAGPCAPGEHACRGARAQRIAAKVINPRRKPQMLDQRQPVIGQDVGPIIGGIVRSGACRLSVRADPA